MLCTSKRNRIRRIRTPSRTTLTVSIKEQEDQDQVQCNLFGHKESQCQKNTNKPTANDAEQVSLCGEAFLAKADSRVSRWCLDSGATTICTAIPDPFLTRIFQKRGKLNLANSNSTESRAEGTAKMSADVFGAKDVSLQKTFVLD